MKIKVLEILNSYPGETFLREHAKAIINRSKDIDLTWGFTQTPQFGRIKSVFANEPPSYAIPNFNRLPKFSKIFYAGLYHSMSRKKLQEKSALNLIKKIKPDIIHFQFASTAFQWSWLAEKAELPYTFSLRGSDVQVYPYTIDGYSNKIKSIGEKSVRIHAVSEHIKNEFCQITNITPSKISVIRTTVSQDWLKIIRTPKSGTLISIGRLHWRKGYTDLLLAAKALKDKNIAFNILIIGEGPDRQKLEFMIRDLELGNFVRLEGKKSHKEIRDYMSSAEAIVQTSLQEGFPNSLAEAMMAGVPIISTDFNGLTEVIKPGINGWIAKTDDPLNIAECIESCLKNQDQNIMFSKFARQKAVELFSDEVHNVEFNQFYKESM